MFLDSSNQKNFITSGIISFSIYIIVILLFFLYVKTSDVKKFDAFSKTTVLELSILIDENKSEINQKIKKEKIKKSEEIVKKSKSKTAKQQNSVKSLFANVKVKSENIIEKKVNNVVQSSNASRFKAKFEKQRKSDDLSVSSLLNNVKSKASVMPSSQTSKNTDPYYSKIYELLAQRWNPINLQDGLYAKVLVSITSNGSFNYKFLKYSGNESFDNSLISFLNEQVNISYPKHDKGNVTKIEVLFKAKG